MNEMSRNALATTQGFSESSTSFGVTETASAMAAAQGKAQVEARYVMAMRNPRVWDQVRSDILNECKRPTFADNKSVYYNKPIGKDGVQGLGIRFVESALRHMRNVLIDPIMIFEDDAKEVHRVTVTDLEANITYSMDVKVSKSVERSKPADDGTYISMRTNSYGKKTYLVPAQDDDLLNKRGAQTSKAIRTLGLRIIPGDIQDEAIAIVKAVRMNDAAQDPAAARKKVVDAFAEIGVKAVDLVAYLGHAIDQCSPVEIVSLRGLYGAIRDGEATWAEAMENKSQQEGDEKPAAAAKTLEVMSDESFAGKSAEWRKVILSKKKTPAALIATIETKDLLTDAQKLTIDSWAHEAE